MKEKTETAASSKVDVSFGGITFNMEGPETFVREGWEYLRSELLPHLEKTLRGRPGIKSKKLKRPKSQFAKFYKEKRPKSQPETITTFAYYLTHLEGKEEFMPSDLKRFYGSLGLPISRKIAQSVWDVFKKRGFLIKGHKRGLYKISPKGEEFVEKQLPTHHEEPELYVVVEEPPERAVRIQKNKLKIDPKKLVAAKYYRVYFLNEEMIIQKTISGTIKFFDVV